MQLAPIQIVAELIQRAETGKHGCVLWLIAHKGCYDRSICILLETLTDGIEQDRVWAHFDKSIETVCNGFFGRWTKENRLANIPCPVFRVVIVVF